MTEETWLACTDLKVMLTFLQGKASDRKLQLFACACGRRNLHKMNNYSHRKIMELAERYADGLASIEALAATFNVGDEHPCDDLDAADFVAHYPNENACMEADCAAKDAHHFGTTPADVRSSQCGLLRDIIGNPFGPVAVDPRWLTSTVVALALSIYDDRDFDLSPILADALEDAWCGNADILIHLRGDVPHVRGCWPVDLILGKS